MAQIHVQNFGPIHFSYEFTRHRDQNSVLRNNSGENPRVTFIPYFHRYPVLSYVFQRRREMIVGGSKYPATQPAAIDTGQGFKKNH